MSGASASSSSGRMVPGEYILADTPIDLFGDRDIVSLEVMNAGDRPIQVGSHYHFAEANPSLEFDRAVARGRRLAVPAGTSIRFEPGVGKTVELVELVGARIVPGLRGETAGPLDASNTRDGAK